MLRQLPVTRGMIQGSVHGPTNLQCTRRTSTTGISSYNYHLYVHIQLYANTLATAKEVNATTAVISEGLPIGEARPRKLSLFEVLSFYIHRCRSSSIPKQY